MDKKFFASPFRKLAELKSRNETLLKSVREGRYAPISEKIESLAVVKFGEGGGFNLVVFCKKGNKDYHYTFPVSGEGDALIDNEGEAFLERNGLAKEDIYREVGNVMEKQGFKEKKGEFQAREKDFEKEAV